MIIYCNKWGTLPDGRSVELYTIQNTAGNSVSISTFGGIITSIIMPDASGHLSDIVLGYDTLSEYVLDDAYFGAMIGRYSNRIAHGEYTHNGTTWCLTKNQNGNTLHGGSGFNKKLWTASPSNKGLLLEYHSPHGEDGFPGNLDVSILCSLSEDNCFTMDMTAVSDQDTVCSLTNHSYFNLAGQGTTLNHLFEICAEYYTPTLPNRIPDGSIQSVTGTEFDFRQKRKLTNPKLDVNYVIPTGQKYSASVTDPISGRKLTISSDLPAMQFYTAGGLTARSGKNTNQYGPNSGFCLEPQFFPNSPNTDTFPSCILKKGEVYHHTIRYLFSTNN